MNSRQKGKRVEREAAAALSEVLGVPCRRGVQYQGGPGSPDVIGWAGVHVEVKGVERLNVYEAMAQSVRESGHGEVPIVLHKRNRSAWMVTVPLEWLRTLADRLPARRVDGGGGGA